MRGATLRSDVLAVPKPDAETWRAPGGDTGVRA
jgi:hypothetical protein